mmetsp:Transcript_8190/g.16460  ORF Transcript_8190/g.16460 Transcript_8190/m.16460 type:complete len:217 (+) Transcript_8190:111-761(+)
MCSRAGEPGTCAHPHSWPARAQCACQPHHCSFGRHLGAGGKAVVVDLRLSYTFLSISTLWKWKSCFLKSSRTSSRCQSCATPHALRPPVSLTYSFAPIDISFSQHSSSPFHAATISGVKPRRDWRLMSHLPVSRRANATFGSLAFSARWSAAMPYLSTAFTSQSSAASAASSSSGSFSYLRTALISGESTDDASFWMLVASRQFGVSIGRPCASCG